jgi:hypothetical protein
MGKDNMGSDMLEPGMSMQDHFGDDSEQDMPMDGKSNEDHMNGHWVLCDDGTWQWYDPRTGLGVCGFQWQ